MAYGGLNKSMDAAAEIGRNRVMSKHQIQSECGEGADWDVGRDGRTHASCETKFSGANARTGTDKYSFSPFS